jgi:N-acetylmuramoyl-L-alanine amidase
LVGCNEHATKPVRPPPQVYAPPAPRIEPPRPSPPPMMATRPPLPTLRGKTVVVDAGHGGKDIGTPGTRGLSPLPEKSIVLLVANHAGRLLQDRQARVIWTRTTDRFLELDQRAAIAQRNRADLFVSIHADSAPRNRQACGSTVYVCRGASAQSWSAARNIVHALSLAGIECRGIKQANYRVLVAHPRPAVLVECGFLSNPGDATRLNTQAYRSRLAAAIARGVADYLSR